MSEITRKSVLLECLEYERGIWRLTSKKYNTLEPMKGMEKEFDAQREKCKILEDLIHAYESEPVKRALAEWQKETMEEGPEKIDLKDLDMPRRPLFSERQKMHKESRLYMTVTAIPKDETKHQKRVFNEVYDICHTFGYDNGSGTFYETLRLLSHLEKGVRPQRDYIHLNDYIVQIEWEDMEDDNQNADEKDKS